MIPSKKQIVQRNWHVKKLLINELRLSSYYASQIDDKTAALSPDEQAYKQKVVRAAERTQSYVQGGKDGALKVQFLELALLGNKYDIIAVCERLNISQSTYYNWRKQILRAFGTFCGIYF